MIWLDGKVASSDASAVACKEAFTQEKQNHVNWPFIFFLKKHSFALLVHYVKACSFRTLSPCTGTSLFT